MGTRSLTTIIRVGEYEGKKWSEKIVTMYRQMDGYPEGMGVDLAEFLDGGELVNGISVRENKLVFNGGGCLAAQIVAHFKNGAGGYYLHRGGSYGHGEEYRYEVIVNEETESITLKILEVGYMKKNGDYSNRTKILFLGTPKRFLAKMLADNLK